MGKERSISFFVWGNEATRERGVEGGVKGMPFHCNQSNLAIHQIGWGKEGHLYFKCNEATRNRGGVRGMPICGFSSNWQFII